MRSSLRPINNGEHYILVDAHQSYLRGGRIDKHRSKNHFRSSFFLISFLADPGVTLIKLYIYKYIFPRNKILPSYSSTALFFLLAYSCNRDSGNFPVTLNHISH